MKIIVSLFFISILFFTSCADELISDNIEATWILQMYLRNDVDETSSIYISNYEESYTIDGIFSRSYINSQQTQVSETGDYSIDEEGSTIHISGVSSISDFSEATSSVSTSTVDVVALDKSEYVYSFENGGDKHEFRFIIKE